MPCLTCGAPIGRTGSYCISHRRVEAKAPTTDRGYGWKHQRRAVRLRAEGRPCCLCGDPIDYTLRGPQPWSFTAHHVTPDKAGPIDAAHRRCNEREGRPR